MVITGTYMAKKRRVLRDSTKPCYEVCSCQILGGDRRYVAVNSGVVEVNAVPLMISDKDER